MFCIGNGDAAREFFSGQKDLYTASGLTALTTAASASKSAIGNAARGTIAPHLYDAGRSLDQKLELIAGLLNRLEPALLQRAAAWEDEEIARSLLEFVNPAD